MSFWRVFRFLPARHLVITFTLMNVLLMLLYTKMAQLYRMDADFAEVDVVRSVRVIDATAHDNTPQNLSSSVTSPAHNHFLGRMVYEPALDCTHDDLFIIYVYSGPRNQKRRQLVRETWGNLSSYDEATRCGLRLFFVLGFGRDHRLGGEIGREAKAFGDLLVADFVDAPQNRTLKGLVALTWIHSACPLKNVRFLLKTEDDVFLNLGTIFRRAGVLLGRSELNFLCLLNKGRLADANSASAQNFTPDQPDVVHATYCSRLAYGMTTHTLRLILNSSLEAPLLADEAFFFSSYCIRRIFPDVTVRYLPLSRRRCATDPKSIDPLLADPELAGMAKLHLVHPLPEKYWADAYVIVKRAQRVIASQLSSAGAIDGASV